MKIGDKVVMNDKYHVSEQYKGKVWTVRSEPWECGGTFVVLLEGYRGGYAVDGLDKIEEAQVTAEYIERERAYERLNALGGCGAEPESWADGWDKAIDTAIYELNEIPAADVRPIVHGKWIEVPGTRIDGLADYKCSRCGGLMSMSNDLALEWCGRCGARMDGKDGASQ